MSIKTWKEEFYPIPAQETEQSNAIQHSLTKWTGFIPSNLEKHEVTYELLHDFRFGQTCPLCYHFKIDEDRADLEEGREWNEETECDECPIVQTGFPECDAHDSAWRESRFGDPLTMIDQLEHALRASKKENQTT